MGDLTDINAAQTVKVVGQDPTGVETTPVKASTGGALFSTLRNDSGIELGTPSNPVITNSPYEPTYQFQTDQFDYTKRVVINPATVQTFFQAITYRMAIKNWNIGGRVACEAMLAKYVAATQQFAGLTGGFNSAPDVAAWTNTSIGSAAGITWAYATDFFVEGTGAAKATFPTSDSNDYPEFTYNFPTPMDLSAWRYIHAAFRVTVAAGGGTARTAQIRLTSGTAVRIYQIVGTTTTAPFNVLQWQLIDREIESPDATAGTGTFDPNNVNSISLRLFDGANRTGTIWWDDVRFTGKITPIEKLYSSAGDSIVSPQDPPIIFEVGDNIAFIMKNNSTTVAAEIQASASGVKIA